MAPLAAEVPVFQRPVFWVAFAVLALACATFAVLNFPRAFSIVELELDMDRETALSEARRLADQLEGGPSAGRHASVSTTVRGALSSWRRVEPRRSRVCCATGPSNCCRVWKRTRATKCRGSSSCVESFR